MDKKTIGIIGGIVVVVIIAIIFLGGFGEKAKTEYYVVKSTKKADNALFNDYKTFKKFVDTHDINQTMTNGVTHKKFEFEEVFTEAFFDEKKLVLVPVYEDTSKDYYYSIDSLTYSEDKTEATVTYSYGFETFADVLSSTWYDYMFVEVLPTVEHVNFVKSK